MLFLCFIIIFRLGLFYYLLASVVVYIVILLLTFSLAFLFYKLSITTFPLNSFQSHIYGGHFSSVELRNKFILEHLTIFSDLMRLQREVLNGFSEGNSNFSAVISMGIK